ncbi:MAG: hypothetical protein OEY03_16660, partial [Rhizobacter sp.]|nr:hypothetical protein [Rhizobacter sp.]
MARVLNGRAGREGAQGRRTGYRERIGSGVVVSDASGTRIELDEGLRLEQPWRSGLEVDACLMLGEARASVTAAAARGAMSIEVTFDDAPPLGAPLPLYLLEYDYARHAGTTKVPGDLFGGSLLVRADTVATAPSRRKVGNQRVRSGSTLRSHWSAERPGNTLVLDGASQYAELDDPTRAGKLDGWRNLTIEAWVRPTAIADTTPLVDKGGGKGPFGLHLERLPALEFDGKDDYITLAHAAPLPSESSMTMEAWIRPLRLDGVRTIVAHGYPNTHDAKKAEVFLRIESGQYQFGRWSNKGVIAKAAVPAEDRSGTGWVHLAGVYDAASGTWSVVRNGVVLNSVKKAPAALDAVGDWGIGGNPDPASGADRRLFVGGIGDVRVWSKARRAAEIAQDMVRRLDGNEPGLAANWRLGASAARDVGPKRLHGKLRGKPRPASAFCIAAGLDGVFVRSNEIYAPDKWMHLAAVMVRDQGVHFDGQGAAIDAGSDATLNVSGDLTIEINVRLDQLGGAHALLCKGRFGDRAAGQVPYALSVDPAGTLIFAFEDADGAVHSFRSTHRLVAARPQQIAVIRQSQTRSATALKEVKNPEDSSIETVSDTESITWSDVIFVIDGTATAAQRYAGAEVGGAIDVLLMGGKPAAIRAAAAGAQRSAPRIGTHSGSLTLGKLSTVASDPLYLAGTLCELRIWGKALSLAEIDKPVAHGAEGLVSLWRFDEQASATTRDDVLGVEVTVGAGLGWSIDTAPERAQFTLYCN